MDNTGTDAAGNSLPARPNRRGRKPLGRATLKADPKVDSAAADVLAAYEAAVSKGRPSVECYKAGVDAFVRAHPTQTYVDAAAQAVGIIIAAKALCEFI